MRPLLQLSLLFLAPLAGLYAQFPGLDLPPSGNNQKASVTQFIGPVKVTIDYSSPAVKDRKGKIWGTLVPYGMAPLGITRTPDPWRAGANENTVFSISDSVVVEGKPLAAGAYGLHMIPGEQEWTIIFSKNSNQWGSFFYDEKDDALRVTVKPHKHEFREYLTYEFPVRRPSETTLELQWEELAVPISIQADANGIYLTRLKRELTGLNGFDYRAYDAAAQFCAQTNSDLDQGLLWADYAIGGPGGIGQTNFDTLSTKALILGKLGRNDEVKTVMDTALHLPGTTPLQIHQYGRQLISAHKNAEAMAVFELNAQRNGEAWPVHVGLMRGYSATGDVGKALEHAKKALAQAPDDLNRNSLEGMVKTLSEGKPIAQ